MKPSTWILAPGNSAITAALAPNPLRVCRINATQAGTGQSSWQLGLNQQLPRSSSSMAPSLSITASTVLVPAGLCITPTHTSSPPDLPWPLPQCGAAPDSVVFSWRVAAHIFALVPFSKSPLSPQLCCFHMLLFSSPVKGGV